MELSGRFRPDILLAGRNGRLFASPLSLYIPPHPVTGGLGLLDMFLNGAQRMLSNVIRLSLGGFQQVSESLGPVEPFDDTVMQVGEGNALDVVAAFAVVVAVFTNLPGDIAMGGLGIDDVCM